LVPIDDPKVWAGPLLFIKNITYPSGSLFAFTITENKVSETQKDLDDLLIPLKNAGILVNSTILSDREFLHGAKLVIQTLKARPFRPNILFLTLGNAPEKDSIINDLVLQASANELGTMILRQHSRVAFGMQKTINLWLRDKSPNWHLAMLVTLHLQLNWSGKINLVTVAEKSVDKNRLYTFLESLNQQARLPSTADYHVLVGPFQKAIKTAPRADINIFGLGDKLSFDFMRNATEWTKSSALFVKDSGWENALV
jgi:hypothetical protein